MQHRTMEELETGLAHIRKSPKDDGRLVLIVRRPRTAQREVIPEGELNLAEGLVGDSWRTRGSKRTPDGRAHPELQLTLVNARVIELVASEPSAWPLAGDQLYVDLDLSLESLPAGTQLTVGSAVIEITPYPHTGCRKFAARYGEDAVKFVNSATGKQLRLRGVNAKVIQPGVIRTGDVITRRKAVKHHEEIPV